MRTAYLKTLFELAAKDRNVIALISDNGAIVYDEYRKAFGRQYFNMGISEENMLGVAAGMANCGKIPFAYTIGAFLAYHALEFIRNDICLQKMNVKIVGTGAGMIYSALGPTHHATEDIGCIRSLPNLVIISPASPIEVQKATKAAYEYVGPVYLRLGTNNEQEIYDNDYQFEIGKGVKLFDGDDVTIIGTGNIMTEILKAREQLINMGIKVRVINMHTIKPIDKEIIRKAINETKAIVTVEDHNVIGGLGSAVAEVIAESGKAIHFARIGLVEKFAVGYGSYDDMKKQNKLDAEEIVLTCQKVLS